MLQIAVWEPKPRDLTADLLGVRHEGTGSNTYVVDVFDNAEKPVRLSRTLLCSDESLAQVSTFAQQYPNKWHNLWKEKFLKQKEELFPLDMIHKVTETDMSTEQKLYLIDLICKEQLSDNN